MTTPAPTDPVILDATRSPDLFPHAAGPVELIETHISWVFLTADRAYKLRKPVVFPFLDYGTAERRRTMCDEELRLGCRLAPEVYVGVRALVVSDGRISLAAADDPDALEHVVEMRRFAEDETLAFQLERKAVSEDDVRRVAHAVARFHATTPEVPTTPPSVTAVADAVAQNFVTLMAHADVVGADELATGHRFAVAFLHGHRHLLEERASTGCMRECHGDLRAEHVLLRDSVQVVDPLEFDPKLRDVDVEADLGFLVMDLCAAGREDLAMVLVDSYRRHSSFPWSETLLWFYAAYRAWVRTKVECLRAGELKAGEEQEAHLDSASRLAALGSQLAWRARRPLTLVVCGGSATGKTTLAQEIAARSGLAHLNSDVVRKELAGLGPDERAPQREYSEGASLRTYRELGRRAATAQGGAVVDATFRRIAHRAAFSEGYGSSAPAPVFVECVAPPTTLAERARRREGQPRRVSDATPELVERMRVEFEPLDEVSAPAHRILRTDRPITEIVDDVSAGLDARLMRDG